MKVFAICYIIVSIIYSIIFFVDGYFIWKKKLNEEPVLKATLSRMKVFSKQFLNSLLKSKRNKQILFNPYTIFVVLFFLIISCPLIFFPLSIVEILHNIFWYKTIQKRKKDVKEAKNKSEDWLKNEGEVEPVVEPIELPKNPVWEVSRINVHGFDVRNPSGR